MEIVMGRVLKCGMMVLATKELGGEIKHMEKVSITSLSIKLLNPL
jgi:hypothetical protein